MERRLSPTREHIARNVPPRAAAKLPSAKKFLARVDITQNKFVIWARPREP
jgi:hypothetical protein